MKYPHAFCLAALSIATCLGATLHAQYDPAYLEPSASCTAFEWEDAEEHPLFSAHRPHLLSFGGDFLTARAHRSDGLKHNCMVFMPGAHVGYDYLCPDALYVGLRGELGWFQKNTSHRIIEKPSLLEARLGYNISYTGAAGHALISPYIGFGAASSKVRFDKLSHVRASYVCLGVRSRYALCSTWSIGCDAQAIRTLSVHSHTVRHKAGDSSKLAKHMDKVKLGNRWTGELAIPVTYYMGAQRQWSIEAAPYITGFTLSNIRPAYGARVTLGCRF